MTTIQVTQVAWNEISKVGMPPPELHRTPDGLWRTFLVRTEFRICTAYAFDDNSGFSMDENIPEAAIAWAIVDGF